MFFLAAAVIGWLGLTGCDFPEPKRPVSSPAGVDIDTGTAVSGGGSGHTDSRTPQAPTPQAPAVAAPQQTENRTVAQVGDSGFSRGQFGKTNIINYAANSFFRTNERINLMMIENNMKLYKAGHDNQVPQSYEEYKREVLPGIKLPDLKDGCRYEYDPKTGDLYIVHPE